MSYKKDVILYPGGNVPTDVYGHTSGHGQADVYLEAVGGPDVNGRRQAYQEAAGAAPPPPSGLSGFLTWIGDIIG